MSQVKQNRQEGDVILWLHELGYNIFNINSLTDSELRFLVDVWNRREKKKDKDFKKSKRKGKR